MLILANIFGFGNPVELAIIAGVVVLLFGGSKLAGFGKSAGEALKEFKKATSDLNEPEVRPSAPPVMEDSKPLEVASETKTPATTVSTAKE